MKIYYLQEMSANQVRAVHVFFHFCRRLRDLDKCSSDSEWCLKCDSCITCLRKAMGRKYGKTALQETFELKLLQKLQIISY